MTREAEDGFSPEKTLIRTLCNGALDACFLVDQEGRVIAWNAPIENLLCLSAQDSLGKDLHQLLTHLGCPDSFSDGPFPFYWTARNRDGTTVAVEMSITPAYVEDQWYGLGIVHKASDQTQSAQTLQEIKGRYLSLFERSIDGVYLLDFKGNFIDANRAALNLIGHTKEELHSLSLATLLAEEQVPLAMKSLQELFETGKTKGSPEYKIKMKNGGYRWIETRSAVIYQNGKPFLLQGIIHDIDERKKTENTLREIEERYRSLFERSMDVIYIHDLEGRFVDVNPEAVRITGYTKEEILSKNISDLLPEDQLRRAMVVGQELLKTGIQQRKVEYQIKKKDGGFVWVETMISPIYKNGKPVLVQGIAHDITARKQTAERLSKINNCFINFTTEPIINIQNLTALIGELLGAVFSLYIRREKKGFIPVSQWHLPTDYQLPRNPEDCTFYEVIRDGETKPYLFRDLASTIYGEKNENIKRFGLKTYFGQAVVSAGKSVGALSAYFDKDFLPSKDDAELIGIITAAIGVEEERQRTNEALVSTQEEMITANLELQKYNQKLSDLLAKLQEAEQHDRESRSRLHSIVEASSDWIWETDAAGSIIYSSPAVQSILGLDPLKMTGTTFDELLSSEKQRSRSQSFVQTLSAHKPFRNVEATFSNRKGHPVILEFNGIPIVDQTGAFLGYQGIARDITHRTEMEFELRQAQKLESVGQMASGIAHEINTPIQFIGDSVMFLRDAFRDIITLLTEYQSIIKDPDQCHSMNPDRLSALTQSEEDADIDYLIENIPAATERILEGVDRVATIVRAMKEFAHPDVREKSDIDVNKSIQSTLTVARNEYKYVANIETVFGEVPPLLGYAGEFNQVILNLLINATHAIRDVVGDSGKKGTITIRTSVENNNVLIEIRDTGAGIPENIRHKIFDPFFTTKEVGRGTGQGLTIAHLVIVDKHKGSISFDSEVGKGTTFSIRLPFQDISTSAPNNSHNG